MHERSRQARLRRPLALATAAAASLLLSSAALAHPEHGRQPVGEGPGRLPGVVRNVELVGHVQVGDGAPGRIADVAAYGNHAYLAGFREPDCTKGGVHVVDIADPARPVELAASFIPAAAGSFVGEGVQVLAMSTPQFSGQVLLHNNEVCGEGGLGGLSIWDVTDPLRPEPLAQNVGDTTGDGVTPDAATPVHEIHSAFGWNAGTKTYAAIVDDIEAGSLDIDIMDITDPRAPTLIGETGLAEFPQAEQAPPPHGDSPFFHDVVVKEVDGKMLMLASYWDAGYVLLDVTNPADPAFLRSTDFAAREPFAPQLGVAETMTAFPPEGNAHQAEFSPDSGMFLAADEDFDAFRTTLEIADGPAAGASFPASNGGDVPPITPERRLNGPTVFVGDACAPLPPAPAGQSALIERGGCSFQQKYDTAAAAGYAGGVVFGEQGPGCDMLLTMAVSGKVPFLFAGRTAGLQLLGVQAADPCATPAGAAGAPSATVHAGAVFDGWGYVHLYDATTMSEVARFAIPEALDREYALGFGDLSVHEVTTDPARNLAYASYYSGGLRVLEYGPSGIHEVGAFIDAERGNNFWGIQLHTIGGEQLVLASDRDSGLWIFRYAPPAPAPAAPPAS
jgi:hypothetical protein